MMELERGQTGFSGKVDSPRSNAGPSCMVRYPVTEGTYSFGQKVHLGMLQKILHCTLFLFLLF